MTKGESVVISFSKITTRGIIILAIISLVGILASGCGSSVPTAPPTAILFETEYIGRILDVNTQQAIVGAKITLDLEKVPPIVYSDSEGIYRFKVIINSTISGQIRVDAQGYEPYIRNISISPANNRIEDIRIMPQTDFTPTSLAPPVASSTVSAPPTSGVLSDVPGTPLQSGGVVTSVVDKDTKLRDVYAVQLSAGQTIQVTTKSEKTIDIYWAKPGFATFLVSNGEFLGYGNSTLSFFAATSGTYYLMLRAEASGAKYTITITITQ